MTVVELPAKLLQLCSETSNDSCGTSCEASAALFREEYSECRDIINLHELCCCFVMLKITFHYDRGSDILFRVMVTCHNVNSTVNNDTQLARDLHRMRERRPLARAN